MVDYYEEQDTPFTDVCSEVLGRPYTYAAHFGPHDLDHRGHEATTRKDTARNLGLDFIVTPRSSRADGIEAVCQLIPRMQFHEEKSGRMIDALRSYHRIYDDKLKTFRDIPVHDWSSHCADATRCMAQNWNPTMIDQTWYSRELQVDTSWVT